MVFLTTDGKLYRHTGTPTGATGFTAAVASADIAGQIADAQVAAIAASKVSGQLTDAQIAAVSAAKLAGQIASGQIADGAISAAKIVNGAVDAVKLADNAVTTAKIANGAIAEGKLADGAATAAKIAAGAVTATKIEDGAISTPKLAVGAVTAGAIAAGAVEAGKIAAGAVTATEIATGAITAGKVAANAIGASQIAAGSIVASKLAITGGANLVLDPEYRDIGGYWWVNSTIATYDPADNQATSIYGQDRVLKIRAVQPGADGWTLMARGEKIPVEEGVEYFAALGVWHNRPMTYWSRFQFYRVDGSSAGFLTIRAESNVPAGARQDTGSIVAPAGAIMMRAEFYMNRSVGSPPSDVNLGKFFVAEKTGADLIVDGAITATKIAADAISATHISAGAVTADKVSASAVTADKIATNAVTAAKISAGAVETAKLAAGAVVADKIATGAVVADKIAAGAITTDKLDANAVTTAKLAAGAVTAAEIAAGAIQTKHLVVADLTNMIPNGDFGEPDLSFWGTTANGSLYLLETYWETGVRSIILQKSAAGATSCNVMSKGDDANIIPVKQGEVLYGETAIRTNQSNTSAGAYFRVLFYDKDKVSLSGAAQYVDVMGNAPITTSWVKYGKQFTVPVGAAFARIQLYNHSSQTTVTNLMFDRLILRRAASSELIVDGAVIAEKIASKAISTAKIDAGAVTADQIAANAITAAKIEAGAVETAKLAAGAVVADKIAANAVVADKIAANAVTAAKIEADAVTAAKISAGAVIADKIAAGAVVADKISADAVDASKIKAGAIQAVKIAAGAVETAKLAAGAIVADKIASNAITAAKIQAGAVEAAKIAAGAVEAGKIAAGAVTTDNLSANAVTAGKIAADAVTAGTVAAGAINTRELAAGAVTASTIGVGDFTNLVPDDQLQDPVAWVGPGVVQPTGGATWSNSIGRITFNPDSSANQIMVSKPFAVSVGDEFWTTFQASFAAAAPLMDLRAYLYFYNRLGAQLADPNGGVYVASATTRSSQIYENSAPVIVPSGAFTARWVFWYAKENTVAGQAFAPAVRRKNTGKLIVDGSVKANHITANEAVITGPAQIAQATIESGHIVDLVAGKIRGGTALLGTVTVNGSALGTTTDRANDPAARVNGHTTQIEPGKIRIAGSTTLADWRMGGDETRIDGGNISANTITANKLEIGSRNITLTGVQFEHNRPATNQVYWSAGYIRWINDNGNVVTSAIPAGFETWSSGVVYLYWTKGDNNVALRSTTSLSVAMAPDNICLATYEGGTKLDADYGRTIIDGSSIKTGTVTATQLVKTSALITDEAQIAGAVIKSAHIDNLTIGPEKIKVNGLTTLRSASVAATSAPVSGETVAGTLSFTAYEANTKLLINLDGTATSGMGTGTTPSNYRCDVKLYLNGTRIGETSVSAAGGGSSSFSAATDSIDMSRIRFAAAGTNTIQVRVSNAGQINASSIWVQEFNR